jgi:hypothetical protein
MRTTVVAVARTCLSLGMHLNRFYPLPRPSTFWHAPLAQGDGIRRGACQKAASLLLGVIQPSDAVQNSGREE